MSRDPHHYSKTLPTCSSMFLQQETTVEEDGRGEDIFFDEGLSEFITQSGVSVRNRGGICFAPVNLALEW